MCVVGEGKGRGSSVPNLCTLPLSLTCHHLPLSTPSQVLSRVHFFNWPVSSARGSPSNPFTMLKQIATAEDFVLVKLDIDTPSIESVLVEELMTDKALLSLVDEFFFEHHVDLPPMHNFWGHPLPGTLADSYHIFSKLRQLGVHAHSWP